MRIIPILALLAATACSPLLTGDQAADCLAARNQALQAQQAVSIANGLLAAAIAADQPKSTLDALAAGASAAQSNLVNAQGLAASICIPVAI